MPGDRLELHVKKLKKRGNIWRFACEAIVDGAKVAEAEISAMMSPQAVIAAMMRQTFIHPMRRVEPGAELGDGVRIGPFCHVGADAVLGDGVELSAMSSIIGATTIGDGCKIYPRPRSARPPQNIKHKGGRTTLTIGGNCIDPRRRHHACRHRHQPRRDDGRRQRQFPGLFAYRA